ncbi:D-alanyl-D-alanine carboxypeptidase [Acetilactobacillus jinshanensis]|uniref:D-alanyl-D-alanine carboxypeptidase n=2 Tax=Acetilactobacillus jinshanensis TaxID=1720083 RepID=A0A4P6ZJE3_9LACO|nr:D-alanyl-D-alanine carboxypeptidase [Acetilactobacillus jinshanensis]
MEEVNMREKTRFRLKLAIGVIVILAATGSYGVIQHHRMMTSSRPITTRQIKKRVNYVSHTPSGRKVGQLALIKNPRAPKMKYAKSVVAMDAKTGQILYQRNPNQPRKVASVAKLMTLYLVEQKANHVHGWDQPVKAAQNKQLRKMSYNKKIGGFKFKKSHRYTVRQLFQAAMIQSSNNSAIALGEWVAGNNRTFVKMMNAQAKAWHIKAHFISASGLENDDLKPYGLKVAGNSQAGNMVSAKALAIIAQHLLIQHPGVIKTSRVVSKKVDGQTLYNVNELLPGKAFAKKNLPVDGLKTGFTPDAGFCFVGTEQPKHKDRVITVVLHDVKDMTDTRSLMYFVNANPRA